MGTLEYMLETTVITWWVWLSWCNAVNIIERKDRSDKVPVGFISAACQICTILERLRQMIAVCHEQRHQQHSQCSPSPPSDGFQCPHGHLKTLPICVRCMSTMQAAVVVTRNICLLKSELPDHTRLETSEQRVRFKHLITQLERQLRRWIDAVARTQTQWWLYSAPWYTNYN